MSYQYIKPSEEQIAKMDYFRGLFETLHNEIEENAQQMPLPRGYKLCLTKLEEASFWLNKAITKND